MSTKLAPGFPAAKGKKKKKLGGGPHTSQSLLRSIFSSSLKETHFLLSPKSYQTVPPSSNIEGYKNFSISLVVLHIT